VEVEPKRPNYFQEGDHLGVAFCRERLAEGFSAEAGLASNLGHALGASDVAEG